METGNPIRRVTIEPIEVPGVETLPEPPADPAPAETEREREREPVPA